MEAPVQPGDRVAWPQTLGSAAICSSLGLGLASSKAAIAMMNPGSQ